MSRSLRLLLSGVAWALALYVVIVEPTVWAGIFFGMMTHSALTDIDRCLEGRIKELEAQLAQRRRFAKRG